MEVNLSKTGQEENGKDFSNSNFHVWQRGQVLKFFMGDTKTVFGEISALAQSSLSGSIFMWCVCSVGVYFKVKVTPDFL